MAKVRVEINRKAVRDLLRSPEVQSDLERRAQRIASAAGPGHRVATGVGRNRARTAVIAASYEARRREARDRNLTRSLDAGRG